MRNGCKNLAIVVGIVVFCAAAGFTGRRTRWHCRSLSERLEVIRTGT